jgi:hypothetical protein
MVRVLANNPKVNRVVELKWNHITNPEVSSKAERAPVSGQGLGLTIWYACVWWVIKHYHVGTD